MSSPKAALSVYDSMDSALTALLTQCSSCQKALLIDGHEFISCNQCGWVLCNKCDWCLCDTYGKPVEGN